MFRVGAVMRARGDTRPGDAETCQDLIAQGTFIEGSATLEAAMPMFESTDVPFLPVVLLSEDGSPPELLGVLFHVDALKAYNRALAATAAEEHS
jgi:CIC family chloride channel protein